MWRIIRTFLAYYYTHRQYNISHTRHIQRSKPALPGVLLLLATKLLSAFRRGKENLSVRTESRGETMPSDQQPTTCSATGLLRRPCSYLPPHALHSHLEAVVQGCPGVKGAEYIVAEGTSAVSGTKPAPLTKAEQVAQTVAGTPSADALVSAGCPCVRRREQTPFKGIPRVEGACCSGNHRWDRTSSLGS